MVQKQSEKNDVLSLSRLLENGSVPLKLVTETGSQKPGKCFWPRALYSPKKMPPLSSFVARPLTNF